MGALFSFFIALSISLVILRVASHILKLTGLSEEVASFQARSAFTGTGFTTRESEAIVNHPLRRRVIMALMFVRNVGFVTLISSLVISFFSTQSTEDLLIRFLMMALGFLIMFLISKIRFLNFILEKIVEWAMRRSTKVHAHDYASLLNLAGEFEVSEIDVSKDSWLCSHELADLKLPEEGILVLGIRRQDGYFMGAPQGSSVIFAEDQVILYGREESIRALGKRPAGDKGDAMHLEAVAKQLKRQGKKAEIPVVMKKRGLTAFIKKIFTNKKNG
ncbi:MAG: TrkA C-terminal domain-containing protein [Spirochaetales bacterium]|nr:TrkA C-terminal domain-containing protein [Spirochaetales bacterium]